MDNLNHLPLDHPDSPPLLPDELPDWQINMAESMSKEPISKHKEIEIEARIAVEKKRNQVAESLKLYNLEAEQAILGGLMLAPEYLDSTKAKLSINDFYRRDHQFIYQAILDQAEKGMPIDAVTIADWFQDHPGPAGINIEPGYAIELATTTPSAANIKAYIDIVLEKSTRRKLIQTARAIIDSARDPDGKDSIELLTDANAHITQLCKSSMRGGELKLMETGLAHLYHELEKLQNGSIDGIVPQWESVKKIIPKLESGRLMILAARPGMGKSALALQWALNAAQDQQASALFSLEMGMNELLMRALSNLSNIPMHHLQLEKGINDEEWARIVNIFRKMQVMPLAIDDSSSLTVEQIRARALHFHSQCKEGLKLIVVDYLQLMSANSKKLANRNEEIAHISRNLKNLARELNCPIIALSQLNRSVESRADKTPNMSDLRDSGAIEQDADLVAFLYRPAYYAKDNLPNEHTEEDHAQNNVNNVCSLHIAKNRSGPGGYATLRAELQYCRFQDGTGLNVAAAEQNLGLNQQKMNPWKKAA